MNRMTKRFKNAQMQPDVELLGTIRDGVFRLAEYEDAEEAGLLIRLPCAVGTTIYHIGLEIPEDEKKCYECRYNSSGFGDFYCDQGYDSGWPSMEDLLDGKHKVCPRFRQCVDERKFDLYFYAWHKEWFGITWFLNREDAEAKIMEMAGQNA